MKYIYFLFTCLLSQSLLAQCPGSLPAPNLGNDTTICQGQNLLLDADPQDLYDQISWDNGSTSSQRTISASGTYTVDVLYNIGANLIQNPGFEQDYSSFSSDYQVGTVFGPFGFLSDPGTYMVTTSPNLAHNNFNVCQDHTPAPGTKMMVVNGSGTANQDVWYQTVPVLPNTDYLYSVWVTNALDDANVARLQFKINGIMIQDVFTTGVVGCVWEQFSVVWNSGSNTTADVRLVNQNTVDSGNDFALDDFFLASVCRQSDDIQVSVESPVVDAGPDKSYCENALETVTATVPDLTTYDIVWSSGETTNTISPDTTLTYTATVTSENGCVGQDDVHVTVTDVDWTIAQVLSFPTSCSDNNGVVSGVLGGTYTGVPSYEWSGPGANSSNTIDASVWQNLSAGWYYLDVVINGCSQNDSIMVDVTTPPVVDVNVTPQTGSMPLSVAFTDNSSGGNTYSWNFGDGSPTVISANPDEYNHVYEIFGEYTVEYILEQENCSDTVYFDINVLLPPPYLPMLVQEPNIFSPNGDKINDVFQFNLINVAKLEMTILNRWGDIVYTSDEVAKSAWDGKSNGQDVKEGTYFYKYTATSYQEEVVEGHGFVQVVRD
jgi:gliding motility-associated-like protein